MVMQERQFLIDRALELTAPGGSSFMGFLLEELQFKASRVPPLPIGGPRVSSNPAQAREKLVRQLTVGQAWQRALAAIHLANHEDPDTVFSLLRTLGDRDSDVRVAVLWALGKNGSSLVLPPLLEFEKIERDKLARCQLAATLYRLITRRQGDTRKPSQGVELELSRLEGLLEDGPDPELLLQRGKMRIRAGALLEAIGDFSRCLDERGFPSPRALLYRSQGFLLMGKPLFALDDLVGCPEEYDYPPIYYLHRVALITLARQIVATARERGLIDYARLFEKRLERLESREE